LDLLLLAQIWPIALTLAAARALATILGQKISSNLAKDPPLLKKWGWSSLISQAGLTLGLSVVIESAFPELGAAFRSLVIATVAINEVIGPVLFKFALDRVGESGTATRGEHAPGAGLDEAQRPSSSSLDVHAESHPSTVP
jgi:hypothetical protein